MIATEATWLEEPKAGDEVIIVAGRPNEENRLATVQHATRTRLIVDGDRYNRQGFRTGDTIYRYHLMRTTPENKEIAQRRAAGNAVLNWMNYCRRDADDLTLEQWQRIQAIINEAKTE